MNTISLQPHKIVFWGSGAPQQSLTTNILNYKVDVIFCPHQLCLTLCNIIIETHRIKFSRAGFSHLVSTKTIYYFKLDKSIIQSRAVELNYAALVIFHPPLVD